MYQSSTRNKITELQNHKKILKKEVIDLRQKLEDALSELNLVAHKETSHRLEVDQERKKAELLERYVDKMESQVKVQQNMMEMMSAAGSVHGGLGSVHGGLGSSRSHFEVTVPHTVHSPNSYQQHGSSQSYNPHGSSQSYQHNGSRNVLLVNTPSDVGKDKPAISIHDDVAARIQMPTMGPTSKQVVNDDDDDGLVHPYPAASPMFRRGGVDDSDNKSHMSELTEDRTQKQFDALHYLRESRELREREMEGGAAAANNARILRYSSQTPSPQGRGPPPPAYILGGGDNPNAAARYSNSSLQQQQKQQLLQNFQNPENAKLGTINSGATAVTTPNRLLPPDGTPKSSRKSPSPQQDSNHTSGSLSLGSGTPGRLSVAQRARLQADRGSTTPVKIRLDSESTKQILGKQQPKAQQQPEPSPASPVTSPNRPRPTIDRRPSNASSSVTGHGFFSNIGRKLEAAIDKSVFSVDVHHRSDEDESDDDDLSSDDGSRDDADLIEQERDNASGERYDRESRKPAAVLTRETLDGHNQERGLSPTRKDTITPSGHMSSRRHSHSGYDSASSVFSDEKKTPTPDRAMVSANE